MHNFILCLTRKLRVYSFFNHVTKPFSTDGLSIAAAMVLTTFAIPTMAQTTTTVVPVESTDVIYNPGVGMATFHFAWDRSVPLSAYPTARVAYLRWHWSDLEPQPGVFNFKLIDDTIAKARARNQDLAFRIMPGVPSWLKAMGVGQVGSGVDVLPDHNDPQFVSYHERLLQAFGERYAGSIDVDHVDIGSVGCWGEWNSACCPAGMGETCKRYMPTEANRQATVNWYYKYFRNTRLVALVEAATYANTVDAGWRGDCFGDYGMFSGVWNHMRDLYQPVSQKPEVIDAWKKAPVQFEACGQIKDWYYRGYNIDTILQKGLDWHISVFNGKDGTIPTAWRAKFDEWLKKMGYRFVLSKLTHSNDVAAGTQMQVSSVWVNRGVAPAYRAWPVAFRIRNSTGAVAAQWKSTANVRNFLPGIWPVQDSFQLPANLPGGTYSLETAILREDSSRAYVELANAGKLSDLWYKVSSLRVVTGDTPTGADEGSTPDSGSIPDPVGAADSASFVGTDVTTRGNWPGMYGLEGYNVVNNGSSYPVASVQGSGYAYTTWAASSQLDDRALTTPGSPVNRIASAYQSPSSFEIRLRFNDTLSHEFALYMLDWNTANTRRQKVELVNTSGVVLDTRSVANFSGGQYLVWNLRGAITIRVTNMNPASTAVVSGFFFGGPRPRVGTATFLKTDITTKGDWKEVYGEDGYSILNNLSLYPTGVRVSPANVWSLMWSSGTTDPRALFKAEANATNRIAAAWADEASFTIGVTFPDNTSRQFGMYFVDWDRKNRRQKIDVFDSNGALLDSRTISAFGEGQHLVWTVSGKLLVRVTTLDPASTAVVSGLFFR